MPEQYEQALSIPSFPCSNINNTLTHQYYLKVSIVKRYTVKVLYLNIISVIVDLVKSFGT